MIPAAKTCLSTAGFMFSSGGSLGSPRRSSAPRGTPATCSVGCRMLVVKRAVGTRCST